MTSLYNKYYYGENYTEAQRIQTLFVMNLDKVRYQRFRQAVVRLQRSFRTRTAKNKAIHDLSVKLVDDVIANAIKEVSRRNNELSQQLETEDYSSGSDSDSDTDDEITSSTPYFKTDTILNNYKHKRIINVGSNKKVGDVHFYNPMYFNKTTGQHKNIDQFLAFKKISSRYPQSTTVKTYNNMSTQTITTTTKNKPFMVSRSTQTSYYPYLNQNQINNLLYKKYM